MAVMLRRGIAYLHILSHTNADTPGFARDRSVYLTADDTFDHDRHTEASSEIKCPDDAALGTAISSCSLSFDNSRPTLNRPRI